MLLWGVVKEREVEAGRATQMRPNPERPADPIGRKNVRYRPEGQRNPGSEEQDVVRETLHKVQVVQRRHDSRTQLADHS